MKDTETNYTEALHSSIDSNLFQLNPLPTWIYETETLKFLHVNDAAVELYGYSVEEFLDMTIADIRPSEEIPKLILTCTAGDEQRNYFPCMFHHRKKNGDVISVDVHSNPIVFNGTDAKIVVVKDITASIDHITFIEKQNEALQRIAQIQSHGVRAPLARVMGFVRLLTNPDFCRNDDQKILNMLSGSADELDVLIRQIISLTYEASLTTRFVPVASTLSAIQREISEEELQRVSA